MHTACIYVYICVCECTCVKTVGQIWNQGFSELEECHGHCQTSHAVCGGVFGGSKSALCDYFLVCVCRCSHLHRTNQASVLFKDIALLQRFSSMHLKHVWLNHVPCTEVCLQL